MPSHSKKQSKFMRAVCHNKEFADKVGVPQDVGCEFEKADKKSGKYSLHKKINEAVQLLETTDDK